MPEGSNPSSWFMADDTQDGRKELKSPAAQKMLRQWLNTDGPKGNNPQYDRGYEFTFRFSDEDRKFVLGMMERSGRTFEDAFDLYVEFLKAKEKYAPEEK